jgi:plasmid stabilization system protein ParE
MYLDLRRAKPMDQISRFVVWICSRFNREQIEKIIKELSDVLKSRREFPSKPKDAFKDQHPNYRQFTVDPTPPLTEPGKKNKI